MRIHEFLIERITDPTAPNPALLTWAEYYKIMNPEEKHVPSNAFDHSLEEVNFKKNSIEPLGSAYGTKYKFYKIHSLTGEYIVVIDPNEHDQVKRVVGYVRGNTLYGIRHINMPSVIRDIPVDLDNTRPFVEVKYPGRDFYTEYFKQNKLKGYPKLLNRLTLKGEVFEFREGDYRVIKAFNSDNMQVGMAADEWGAILVAIVPEYRGHGIGEILGKMFREANPHFISGGFTNAGAIHAKRIWANFVREYLQAGDYSKLVRAGKITIERVKEILADLPERKRKSAGAAKIDYNDSSSWAVHHNGYGGFVVYHKSAASIDSYDMSDWGRAIKGYSFLRVFELRNDWHLYQLDYDTNEAEVLLLKCTLTFMFEEVPDQWLVLDKKYSAYSESIEKLSGVEVANGRARATKPLIDLRALERVDRGIRRNAVNPDEFISMLIESAENKYQ